MFINTNAETPAVLSIDQCCRYLGLSKPMIYREINQGELRTFRVGARRMISEDALREWIKKKEDLEAKRVK